MVTQTLLSFKCNDVELQRLDETCRLAGLKRNIVLNILVSYANNAFKDIGKYAILTAMQSVVSNEFK